MTVNTLYSMEVFVLGGIYLYISEISIDMNREWLAQIETRGPEGLYLTYIPLVELPNLFRTHSNKPESPSVRRS